MPIRKLWPEVQVLYDLLCGRDTALPFDYCRHCDDDKAMNAIQETPPLLLSDDELFSLKFTLMATVGDESTFKYFLPVLLQWAIDDDEDVASLLAKAKKAGLVDWPRNEREALTDVVLAWAAFKYAQDVNESFQSPLAHVLPAATSTFCLEGALVVLDGRPRRQRALLGACFLSEFSDLIFAPGRMSRSHLWSDTPDEFDLVVAHLKKEASLYLEFADDEALVAHHNVLMEVLDVWDRERCAEADEPSGATR